MADVTIQSSTSSDPVDPGPILADVNAELIAVSDSQVTTTSGSAQYSIGGFSDSTTVSDQLEVLGPQAFNSTDPVNIRASASSNARADATGGRPLSSPAIFAQTDSKISAPIEDIGFEFNDGTFVTQQQLGVELVKADVEITIEELFEGALTVEFGSGGLTNFVPSPTGDQGQSVRAVFEPLAGGISLTEAAQIFGVDHFNWVQFITGVPQDWQVETFSTVGVVPLTTPFFDPPINSKTILITDIDSGYQNPGNTPGTAPLKGLPIIAVPYGAAFGDSEEPYYNETPIDFTTPEISSVFDTRVTKFNSIEFFDAPRMESSFYEPGEFISFETELVGVRSDGSIKPTGLGFTWKSNTTTAGTGTASFGNLEGIDLSSYVSGGIFDVELFSSSSDTAAVPEPGSFLLMGIAAIGFGGYQFRRRRHKKAAA